MRGFPRPKKNAQVHIIRQAETINLTSDLSWNEPKGLTETSGRKDVCKKEKFPNKKNTGKTLLVKKKKEKGG